MDKQVETGREKESKGLSMDSRVSRRQFLGLVGLAGATVVVGGGIGELLAGCSGGGTPASTTAGAGGGASTSLIPKSGGVMTILTTPIGQVIGWPSDPTASAANFVVQTCFETLLQQDAEGNLVPWLAESYKLADNLSSMTFNLRKGVKFHDGSDFNAEVAKWNLDNYIKARLNMNWGSADIIDPYTIRLNFVTMPGKPMTPADWDNTLPDTVADSFNAAYMVSKAAYDKNGLVWMKTNPVGTGPFMYKSFSVDAALDVVKNPGYWVKGKPYLDGINFRLLADPGTIQMAMEAKQGDMTTAETGKATSDYQKAGMNVKTLLNLTEVLIPDSANPGSPWSVKEVREAAEYAIDRESIAKMFGYGQWEAPYQLPPRATKVYNPDFQFARKYDPEKAKQLLAQAGHAKGFKTTLIVFPEAAIKSISLVIQSYLAAVGIQAELQYPLIAKYNTYMFMGKMPTNSLLYQGLPMIDVSYMPGLEFMFLQLGPSWARPAGIQAKLKAAQAARKPDVALTRAVTDQISQEAALIPINELGTGLVTQKYVEAGFNERGNAIYFNTQNFWLNK